MTGEDRAVCVVQSSRTCPLFKRAMPLHVLHPVRYTRWDGAKVEDFRGTYGEYILRKVMRICLDGN